VSNVVAQTAQAHGQFGGAGVAVLEQIFQALVKLLDGRYQRAGIGQSRRRTRPLLLARPINCFYCSLKELNGFISELL